MAIFLTADWHLGEDRFEIMQRPFQTTSQMGDYILERHNARVEPSDTVYHLGDVCYQKRPDYLDSVRHFNGRKILVRGNHDRIFTDEQLRPYFDEIVPEGEGRVVRLAGIDCWMTHYPTRGRADLFNLVAHIHSTWKHQLNSLNVGVDVHAFCPVPEEKIAFHYRAICEFYDDDVWAAYLPANATHRGRRGKEGSYLK